MNRAVASPWLVAAALIFGIAGCATGEPQSPASNTETQPEAGSAGGSQTDNGNGGDPTPEPTSPSAIQDPDDDQTPLPPTSAGGVPSALICELPAGSGEPMGEDQYIPAMGEINYNLEQLVFELAATHAKLTAGTADQQVALEMAEHAYSFAEITAPVLAISPPIDAAPWHERVVQSWLAVCEGIKAGELAAQGEAPAFAKLTEALEEQPTLGQQIHANTMKGPFE